jgi:hypothetical protein
MSAPNGKPLAHHGFGHRFEAYAEAIASLVDDPSTATPLTIGVNGPWGTGKSVLARHLVQIIRAKPAAAGRFAHVVCWFNVWMHDDADSIATALVSHVAQTADRMRPWWRRFRSPLPISLAPPGERMKRRLVLLAVTLLLAIVLSQVLVTVCQFSTILKYVMREVANFDFANGDAAMTGGDAKPVHDSGWLFVMSTFALLIARRFAEVGHGLGGFLKDPQQAASAGSIDRVRQQLGALIRQATPPGSRFVLFVDELDLCRPPHCIDVLETISQLLDHPDIVSIVMADVSAVAAHAEIKYEKLASKYVPGWEAKTEGGAPIAGYGRVYLQKFIQMQFNLPFESERSVLDEITRPRRPPPDDRHGAWRELARQTLAPLRDPVELARSSRGVCVEESGERDDASRSGPFLGPAVETILGPLARLWDLPPGLMMLLVGPAYVALLPARLVAFAAPRISHPAALRPFPVCKDRPWEHRVGSALSPASTVAVWGAAITWAVSAPGHAFWARVAAGACAMLFVWLAVVLWRIDERDGRGLVALRASGSAKLEGGADVVRSGGRSRTRPCVRPILEAERRRLESAARSADLTHALDEALRHLPGLPRVAKRVSLLLRVEIDVLRMLGLLDGRSSLTMRHVGKWVALEERWPLLGSAAREDCRLIVALENAAVGPPERSLAVAGADDPEVRAFFAAVPRLGEVAETLTQLWYREPGGEASIPS